MREIRFRGLGRDSDDWYYGYYVEEAGEATIVESSGYVAYVRRETVGQFTGLRDSNGVDVYEHDVIDGRGRGVVQYDLDNLAARFVIIRGKDVPLLLEITQTLIEVIGNVWQHPQLVEGMS